jgi:hypothetical protein
MIEPGTPAGRWNSPGLPLGCAGLFLASAADQAQVRLDESERNPAAVAFSPGRPRALNGATQTLRG